MTAALVGVSAAGVVGALVAVPLLGAAKAVYLELRPRAAATSRWPGVEPGRGRREPVPGRPKAGPIGSLRPDGRRPTSRPSASGSSSTTAPPAPTSRRMRPRPPTTSAGPQLEGCNEMLVATRPDVIADLHDVVLRRRLDVVETDIVRRRCPSPLAEYGIADRAHELQRRRRPSIAREVADGLHARPAPLGGRLDRARAPRCPSLGQIRFAELRDAYEVAGPGPARRRRRPAARSRPCYDLLQAKAAIIGCRRAMAAAGREVPHPGPGHHRADRPHAARHRDRRRPDRPRRHAARRHRPQLRHRPARDARAPPPPVASTARCRSRACPTPACRRWSTGKMHYDLTPDAAGRAPRPLHHRARRHVDRRLLRHHARAPRAPSSSAARDLTPARRAARRSSPAPPRSTRPCRFDQDTSFLVVGERTNANGSKKFREAMLAERLGHLRRHGQGAGAGGRPRPRRVRRLHRRGRRRRHGRDRQPLRHPGQRSRSCSTPPSPQVIEAGLQWIGGKAILNSVNLEDGDAPGTRLDRFLRAGRASTAPPSCARASTRRARPAPPTGSCGRPRPSTTWPSSATASSPSDLIFDTLALPAVDGHGGEPARRHRDHRGHPPHQGRAARRLAPSSACRTCRSASTPAARHVLNSVFLHECVRGRARRRHRPRRPGSCR